MEGDEELILPFTINTSYDLIKSSVENDKDGEEQRFVEGIASLETPDLEGETMVQKGMNVKPFLDFGHLNWDHGTVKYHSPAYIIGEPTEAKVVQVDHARHGKVDGLFVKGFLYKGPYKPLADDAWNHMQMLAKSHETRRKMGMSIEGKARIRHGRMKVATSDIYNIALTPSPMHPDSHVGIAGLVKSLTVVREFGIAPFLGHGITLNDIADAIRKSEDGGSVIGDTDGDGTRDVATIGGYRALLREDLEHKHGGWKRGKKGRLKVVTSHIWGDAPCPNGCYTGRGSFAKGVDGARDHLVKCRGWDAEEADALVKGLGGIFGK